MTLPHQLPYQLPQRGSIGDDADLLALRRLVESYAFAVDRRDMAWFTSLWTPDASLSTHRGDGEPQSHMTGHEELATVTDKIAKFPLTLHLVFNHRCEVTGDTAIGETYCIAHHLTPRAEADGPMGTHDDLVMAIRYADRYRRAESGEWLFEHRECRKQWEQMETVRGYFPAA